MRETERKGKPGGKKRDACWDYNKNDNIIYLDSTEEKAKFMNE